MPNSYKYDIDRAQLTAVRREASLKAKYWTEEDDAQAAAMWRQGCSASEIGEKIGRSRNSVVSRMHRLRVPTPASPSSDGFPLYNPKAPRNRSATAPAARDPNGDRSTPKERQAQLRAEKSERMRAIARAVWANPERAARRREAIAEGLRTSEKYAAFVFERRAFRVLSSGAAGPMRPAPWHPLNDNKRLLTVLNRARS